MRIIPLINFRLAVLAPAVDWTGQIVLAGFASVIATHWPIFFLVWPGFRRFAEHRHRRCFADRLAVYQRHHAPREQEAAAHNCLIG